MNKPDPANVSRETLQRLEAFSDLLIKWNRSINLVSPADIPHLDQRHVADSAQVFDLAPSDAKTWIDLGTGAGFPGLICAIYAIEQNPDCRFTLIESDGRKCAFLREAIRLTGAPAEVITNRIERTEASPVDVISARALAPLSKLLNFATQFSHPGTTMLFPKGANAESELTQARADWHINVERMASVSDSSGTILKLTEVAPLR